jgi:ubiquinone/menaquinone biosynthesis C-methylase UbiE
LSKKGYKGLGMNGGIAKWYSKIVEKDYAQYRELAERIKKMLPGKKAILEVAPGPGFLSVELAKQPDFQVTGMDISETFVRIAGEKAKEVQVSAKFLVGNVSEMPLTENQFDLVVCRAAFKNFAQPVTAINEIFRVLKPGGKALIIDMRKDITNQEIASYVNQMDAGKWDRMMTSWAFKHSLRKRVYSLEQIKQLSANSKFKSYRIDPAPMGFEWWLEK